MPEPCDICGHSFKRTSLRWVGQRSGEIVACDGCINRHIRQGGQKCDPKGAWDAQR